MELYAPGHAAHLHGWTLEIECKIHRGGARKRACTVSESDSNRVHRSFGRSDRASTDARGSRTTGASRDRAPGSNPAGVRALSRRGRYAAERLRCGPGSVPGRADVSADPAQRAADGRIALQS